MFQSRSNCWLRGQLKPGQKGETVIDGVCRQVFCFSKRNWDLLPLECCTCYENSTIDLLSALNLWHLSDLHTRLRSHNNSTTVSGTQNQKGFPRRSICQTALVWACIKQKKKRKILHKYLNKAELCLACNSPPNTHPLTHTHLLILHTVLPPYAKNYHTGISLYPYLNIAEKNWAFIWKRGCVFIQQCQHQERRETPHCCWCKQERVRDWRPGRRNEWRLTERRKKKPFERQ